MSRVMYGGKRLVPAPFFSSSVEPVESADGKKLGEKRSLTLRGKLVAHKGSPDSAGAFWDQPDYPPDESVPQDSRLGVLLTKKAALEALFATSGLALEIQGEDPGIPPFKCNPSVRRVENV